MAAVRIAVALLLGCASLACRGRAAATPGFDEGAFVRHYADLVLATTSDAAAGARALAQAVAGFLEAPSPEALGAARAAWRAARRPYLQSEAFRFYDGPIDAVEPLVNGWPVDERYIDAVVGDAAAGIVNQARAYPALSWELLASLNQNQGEKNISTGYHAIEFLLWGQDLRRDGPGDRPYTDYVAPERGARRRGQVLRLLTDGLARTLAQVEAAWKPDRPDNYRAAFLSRPPREASALIVRGVGGLSGPELGGERLTVAYETKDQENEHSCFSDTTHEDILYDLVGIQNVCRGRYAREGGTALSDPGLCALAASVDPELGAALARDIDAAVAAARALPPPFDQDIVGRDDAPGRIAVGRVIAAVEAQTATLAQVAGRLGVRLSLPTLAKVSP